MDCFSTKEKTDSIDDRVNDEIEKYEQKELEKPSKLRTFTADSMPQTIAGTILGVIPDYLTGLNGIGMLISRAAALATNYTIGGFYGWWRERVFSMTNTDQENHFLRRWGTEMLCYETFQVPIYSAGVALGSFISDHEFDYRKVIAAGVIQVAASPVTSLVLGWGMDKSRKALDVEPVAWDGYDKR